MATGAYAHIDSDGLQGAIKELFGQYADEVYQATEEGLDAAEKVLINNLKAASPRKTGEFARKWKSSGREYKLSRYIHNTKMVEGKGGKIPLSNILEYSPTKGRPFIKATFERTINQMAQIIVEEIKKTK